MTKQKLLAATALLALLIVPFAAQAARPPKPNPADILHNPKALARFLKLTPEQVAKQKQLLEQLRSTTKPLYDQIEPLEEQLHDQLEAASPNACAVGGTVVQIDGLRDQIKEARQDFDDAFSAILTPEQLAKYEALKDAARISEEEESAS